MMEMIGQAYLWMLEPVSYTHLDVYTRQQLDYYGRALEQLTRKKVKEKVIYSFALKEELIL